MSHSHSQTHVPERYLEMFPTVTSDFFGDITDWIFKGNVGM